MNGSTVNTATISLFEQSNGYLAGNFEKVLAAEAYASFLRIYIFAIVSLLEKKQMGIKQMRKIFAVILGAVIGTITLLIVGVIANAIHPTPPELMDPATPEAVAQRVASTPTSTWLSTIFGLALGAFLGGFIGARVAKEKIVRVTSAIGLVLSLWAFYTFYIVFPAVLWVPIGMLISVLLFSYLGGYVVKRSHQTI